MRCLTKIFIQNRTIDFDPLTVHNNKQKHFVNKTIVYFKNEISNNSDRIANKNSRFPIVSKCQQANRAVQKTTMARSSWNNLRFCSSEQVLSVLQEYILNHVFPNDLLTAILDQFSSILVQGFFFLKLLDKFVGQYK